MALTLKSIEQLLSYAGPALAGILLVRLWLEGLLLRYRFFAFYLFCLCFEIVILFTVRRATNRYVKFYIGLESAQWIAQILMIIEMFALVLRSYPGIARYWRKFVVLAFVVATAISFGFAAFIHQAGAGQFPVIEKYMLVARVIAFTILAFFVLLLGFLLWFPVPLSRNVVVYIIGFSLYFGSRALVRFAGNLFGPDDWVLLSCISAMVVTACLALWIVFLTRQGESVDVTVGHRWQPGESAALIQQLESINAVLLRSARKGNGERGSFRP